MALLSYRSTPLPWCGLSPAQLLMGRNLRSNLPQLTRDLIPQWSFLKEFRLSNQRLKDKQKEDYDSRHGIRPLADIPDGTPVWTRTDDDYSPGQVTSHADTPRSYQVETPSGQIRRNRAHLTIRPDVEQPNCSDTPSNPTRSPVMTRSRTGTAIAPPDRLY